MVHDENLAVTRLGRSELLPIVGFSIATGPVWKLDASNLKFRRNHVLPFSEVLPLLYEGYMFAC